MKPFRKVAFAHRRIKSLRYPLLRIRLKGRGLSGEHIELCAEGARRTPNLSGKRTETQISIRNAVLNLGLLIFYHFERRTEYDVRETFGCHWVCIRL